MSLLNMFGFCKKSTIEEVYTASREDNNFNLLRVFAALLVIISHSYLFLGHRLYYTQGISLGSLGVDIFFAISGFLVSGSYLHRDNPRLYMVARFLRIWPALMINSILLAFIMGPLITSHPLNSAFFISALKFVYSSSLLGYPASRGLPGVFTGLSYPAVNGALWTLNYEAIMYCIIGLLGIFQFLHSRNRLRGFLIVYVLIYIIFSLIADSQEGTYYEFMRFTSVFFAGMVLQIYKDKIKLTNGGMLLASALLIAFHYLPFKTIFLLPLSISIAYLVIWIAFLPIKLLRMYNKLGDYSYGLYIYGWPVSHVLQKTFSNPLFLTMITIFITSIIAVLSWHLVERKMLNLKQSFPRVESEKSSCNRAYIAIFILLIFLFLVPLIIEPPWPQISL